MAVIDTSMDMPKSCYECRNKKICVGAYQNGWLCNRRDDDCPLKSMDELRKEVLEYIEDLDIANEICEVFDKYCGSKRWTAD